jgi:hypothetical protein
MKVAAQFDMLKARCGRARHGRLYRVACLRSMAARPKGCALWPHTTPTAIAENVSGTIPRCRRDWAVRGSLRRRAPQDDAMGPL